MSIGDYAYLKGALADCDQLLRESAELDLEIEPYYAMRKTRSAIFSLMQAVERIVEQQK